MIIAVRSGALSYCKSVGSVWSIALKLREIRLVGNGHETLTKVIVIVSEQQLLLAYSSIQSAIEIDFNGSASALLSTSLF